MPIVIRRVLSAMLLVSVTPAIAAGEPAAMSPDTQAVLKPIFDGLKAGNVRTPLLAALDRSPLWQPKTAEKDQLASQMELSIRLYGPVTYYELVKSERLGSLAEHDVFIVQHRDNVTRWQAYMSKGPKGWTVAYFGFEDQIQNWFAN